MKWYTDKDLQNALAKLKNDGVKVVVYESGKGDQAILIKTLHYTVRLGANDLGVWLEEYKKRWGEK